MGIYTPIVPIDTSSANGILYIQKSLYLMKHEFKNARCDIVCVVLGFALYD